MVSLADYAKREQSYIKHIFLERYLEALIFKTASTYNDIVYVDGFAGPWQSANEQFEDTSFGIALNALRQAKDTWQKTGRIVRMTAMLVERDAVAYQRLATVPAKYPDITIKTYEADFISAVPSIERDIPADAFAFFLIDPKGWRIPLMKLRPILARQKSEVIFNFMFDFINRAASMKDAAKGLGELIPYGDWHARLIEDEYPVSAPGPLPRERKQILVGAFRESLRQIGGYEFVVEMPVLRPFKDRELYYLCYATRHAEGIKVFRDCQVAALNTESKTRAAVKVQHAASTTGQSEMFESLHDMGPDKVTEFLESERKKAVAAILDLVPKSPDHIEYRKLWPVVLSNHAVRFTDVNAMCAKLRKEEILHFPDWERNKRVPQDHYRAQRIK